MKKFDLEAAKAGAPVCTRDGRPARIICFDRKDNVYPIVALIGECEDDIEEFTKDGCYNISRGDYDDDLFMAPTQHTGYVALYRNDRGNVVVAPQLYSSIDDAREGTLGWTHLVSINEVTWEE